MSARLLMLLLVIQAAAGCANVTIKARDDVNFANLETSFAVGEDASRRLRFRGSGANGDFKQSLDDNERIQFDDTLIVGPAEVDGELDLLYYSIAFGWDDRPAGIIAGKWYDSYYVGIAQTKFDLTLKNAGERSRESDNTVEAYFQYGLDYAVSESLAIGFSWALSIGRDASGISEIDLKAEYQIARRLILSGGYRWFRYNYGDDIYCCGNDSDLEVDFRGPVIGLNFPF